MHKINTNIKSINVFKNHPSNKITISNGGVPCGEFEIVRSGPKVIFSVDGTAWEVWNVKHVVCGT